MRIVRELFRPSLKCERAGHKPAVRERRGYSWPSSLGVADRVTQRQSACRRCKKTLSGWADQSSKTIHSLGMPSDDWDALRRDGFLETGAPEWLRSNTGEG